MKCVLVLAALFFASASAQLGSDGWYGDGLAYPEGDYAGGLDDGYYDAAYPQGVDDADDYDGVDGYLDDDGDDGSYDGALARRWVLPMEYSAPLVRRGVHAPLGASPTIFANAAKLKKNKLKKQQFNFANKKAAKINRKKKTVFIASFVAPELHPMTDQTAPLVYRLFRRSAFATDYYVAPGDSETPIYVIKDPIRQRILLEDAATGQTLWERQSMGALANTKKFISAEYGGLVKLKEKKFFSRTARSFDYAGRAYKWRRTTWANLHYECVCLEDGTIIANFTKVFWTLTFGRVALYGVEAWPPGLKAFVILSAYYVVEEARRRARRSA
ncbi:hypothetical protein H4R35_006600 [Dimargaris xerosporica]|nr:hypothetical protein H4R35_006600 [Dimargaris xerosporica]